MLVRKLNQVLIDYRIYEFDQIREWGLGLWREFWLSEAQWGAIEPLLPKNQPGPAEPTIDACSAGSFMFEDRLPLAQDCLPSTVRRRRSAIAALDDARPMAATV